MNSIKRTPARTILLEPVLELLSDMFSLEELSRHVRRQYPHIDAELSIATSLAAYAQNLAEAMQRTGDFDPDFFAWLIELRPKRSAEIEQVARFCLGAPPTGFDPPSFASSLGDHFVAAGWTIRRHDDVQALSEAAGRVWKAAELDELDELLLWAVALDRTEVAFLDVLREDTPASRHALVIARHAGQATVWWLRPPAKPMRVSLLAALRAPLGEVREDFVDVPALRAHLDGFLAPRRQGVLDGLVALRQDKLDDMDGIFEPPDVRVGDDPARLPALSALDEWIASDRPRAWLVGEYGLGKSTLLVEWAHRRWQSATTPLPLLVSLLDAPAEHDGFALLRRALGVDDAPRSRALLQLLVRHRRIVPCFDGLDEVFTRVHREAFKQYVDGLLAITDRHGRLILSARDHFFPNDAELTHILPGAERLTILRLSSDQVRHIVARQCRTADEVDPLLQRLARAPGLLDLMARPLLCGMVLRTLDTLDPSAQIGVADIYEAYLGRWLRQAHFGAPEVLQDAEKLLFAERFAAELWASGHPALSVERLRHSVLHHMAEILVADDGVDSQSVFYEIQGSAFIVRGPNGYRFAHKSLFEYLLARNLVRQLPSDPAVHLGIRPWTSETIDFLARIIARHGEDPYDAAAIQKVRQWLMTAPKTPSYDPRPNALRLLLGLERLDGKARQWVPPGADLRRLAFSDEVLSGARLMGVRLDHTNLDRCDLTDATLAEASLEEASLCGACLDRASLRDARARGAKFVFVRATGADLRGAVLTDADLGHSTWHACRTEGLVLTDAVLSSTILPPFRLLPLSTSGALQARLVRAPWSRRGSMHQDATGRSIHWSRTGVCVYHTSTERPLIELSDAPAMVAALSANAAYAAAISDEAELSVWQTEPPALMHRQRISSLDLPEERNGTEWSTICREIVAPARVEDEACIGFVTSAGTSITIDPRSSPVSVHETQRSLTRLELPEEPWDNGLETATIVSIEFDRANLAVTLSGDPDTTLGIPLLGLGLPQIHLAVPKNRLGSPDGRYTLYLPWEVDSESLDFGPLEVRADDRSWRTRRRTEDILALPAAFNPCWTSDGSAMASLAMMPESIGTSIRGNSSQAIILWSKAVDQVHFRRHSGATAMAFSLISEVYTLVLGYTDGRVTQYRSDTTSFPRFYKVRALPRPGTGTIAAIACSTDGTRLAYLAADGEMRLLSMPDCHELRVVQIPAGSSLCWSSDGQRLIAGGGELLHCFTADGRLYCRITVGRSGCAYETPAGFHWGHHERHAPRALAPQAVPLPAVIRPLGPLWFRLLRRDRVEAALNLDLAGDDITDELLQLGWLAPDVMQDPDSPSPRDDAITSAY